jgi:hypothetical protein
MKGSLPELIIAAATASAWQTDRARQSDRVNPQPDCLRNENEPDPEHQPDISATEVSSKDWMHNDHICFNFAFLQSSSAKPPCPPRRVAAGTLMGRRINFWVRGRGTRPAILLCDAMPVSLPHLA